MSMHDKIVYKHMLHIKCVMRDIQQTHNEKNDICNNIYNTIIVFYITANSRGKIVCKFQITSIHVCLLVHREISSLSKKTPF